MPLGTHARRRYLLGVIAIALSIVAASPAARAGGDPAPDCNNNGVPDADDIANCSGDPACEDCNGDGRPDECGVEDPCLLTSPTPARASTNEYSRYADFTCAATGTCIAIHEDSGDRRALRSVDGGSTWSEGPFGFFPNHLTGFHNPGIATDDQGTWIAIWQRTEQHIEPSEVCNDRGGVPAIGFSRSADDGATWSAYDELRGGGEFGNCLLEPSIATDGNGTWIIAWVEEEWLDSVGRVAYVRSDDNGETWSAATYLTADAISTITDEIRPRVEAGENGVWMVSWYRLGTGTSGIMSTRSVDGGLTWESAPQAQSGGCTDNNRYPSDVVYAGAGVWIVAWAGSTGGDDSEIWYRRTTDDGATWSDCSILNSDWETDGQDEVGLSNETSSVRFASGGDGTLYALWSRGTFDIEDETGPDFDLFFALSFDLGETWTLPSPMNSTAFTDLGGDVEPRASAMPGGDFAAYWHSPLGRWTFSRILMTAGDDCDCNGTPDACEQWDSGEPVCGDCNDNGVPDAEEIANCNGDPACEDCNGDGRPDECGVEDSCLLTSPTPARSIDNTSNRGLDFACAATGTCVAINEDFDDPHAVRSVDGGSTWSWQQIASNPSNRYHNPGIATDDLGTWIAVWQEQSPPAGPSSEQCSRRDGIAAIGFSRSNDDGVTWSNRGVLTNGEFNCTLEPAIATDGNGTWIIVWVDGDRFDTSGRLVYSRSNDNGETWSAVADLTTDPINSAAGEVRPRIEAGENGVWMVSWHRFDGSLDGIISTRSVDGGLTWESSPRAQSDACTVNNRYPSDVVYAGSGVWIVAWAGWTGAADAEIWYRRTADDGATWSGCSILNSDWETDGQEEVGDFGQTSSVRLASGEDGALYALWSRKTFDIVDGTGSDLDVFYAFSYDLGVTWTLPSPMNSTAFTDGANDSDPRVSAMPGGGFAAYWLGSSNRWTFSKILTSGEDCNCDGTPDVCELWECAGAPACSDCNDNAIIDECDLASGEPDTNGNGTPDACECPMPPSAPLAVNQPPRSRYVAMFAQGAGPRVALRVTLDTLYQPNPPVPGAPDLSAFEGQVRWVGPRVLYLDGETEDGSDSFFAVAQLQCEPYFGGDLTVGGTLIAGDAILPDSTYTIQAIDEDCLGAIDDEFSYSPGLVVSTGRWGDVVEPFQADSPSPQPDVNDILAVVDKFLRPGVVPPTRPSVQLLGNVIDPTKTPDINEILLCVDGYLGKPYPYTGPSACP